jgi:methionyl-tRNA formyltransferase
MQPAKIRTAEFLDAIRVCNPDVGIVIAYGRILPPALLEIPRHGFLNVHGSILPRYRGAAPIQRSIEAGDKTTGVTIMRVDEELDHGAVLAIETLEIGPDERTPSLFRRLSNLGAAALSTVLHDLERGTAIETPQDHALATHAAKIDKQEGLITFDETAATIYARFRAFDPWPGIFIETHGEIVKLTDIRPADASGAPRTILAIHDGVTIAASEGSIRVAELQRAGKPRNAAIDVARGLGWKVGERV